MCRNNYDIVYAKHIFTKHSWKIFYLEEFFLFDEANFMEFFTGTSPKQFLLD